MDALQNSLLQKDTELAAIRREQESWSHLLQQGIPTEEHAAFVAAANVEAAVPKVDVPSPLTPANLPLYVSQLRGTIMGLAARMEGLSNSMDELRTANVDLDRRARLGSENETSLAQSLSEKSAELLRARRQNDVLAEERQRYKELLDSFETQAQGSDTYNQVQAQHVAALEARVEALQTETMSLASRLDEAQSAKEVPCLPPVDTKALDEARASLESLRTQCAQQESDLKELSAENAQLHLRVGRGEFDQTREKCLVLQNNPVSRDIAIRTAALDALRKENAELLEQMEALHKQGVMASSSSDAALVPMQTVDNLKKELARLEASIQLKDKGMLRLKQVFTAKANEFREAVQSLFGYKLRFLENGKVKLTSTYARGARVTTLVFRSEQGNVGEMKLQGEAADGLANVAHLRDYWLSDGIRHSVPCFLAALNLELYENTTQAIRGTFGTEVDE